jgi:hypothetical protein
MPRSPGPTYGRAAMLGVLIALVLTVSAGVYMFMARYATDALPEDPLAADPQAELQQVKRLILLLTILLISCLLILLFVVGSYLLIRVGRFVRQPVAGKPTEYVDAWQQYRLTDEQIAAATAEPPSSGGAPGGPPAPPDPADPNPPGPIPPHRKD